eukprot:1194905-Prorocentrum_minimum.AAC.2
MRAALRMCSAPGGGIDADANGVSGDGREGSAGMAMHAEGSAGMAMHASLRVGANNSVNGGGRRVDADGEGGYRGSADTAH